MDFAFNFLQKLRKVIVICTVPQKIVSKHYILGLDFDLH